MAISNNIGSGSLKARWGSDSNEIDLLEVKGNLSALTDLILGSNYKFESKSLIEFKCKIDINEVWIHIAAENVLKQYFGQHCIINHFTIWPEKHNNFNGLKSCINNIFIFRDVKDENESEINDDEIFENVSEIRFNEKQLLDQLQNFLGLSNKKGLLSNYEQFKEFSNKLSNCNLSEHSNMKNNNVDLNDKCGNKKTVELNIEENAWLYILHYEMENISKHSSNFNCDVLTKKDNDGNHQLIIESKTGDDKQANKMAEIITDIYQKYLCKDDIVEKFTNIDNQIDIDNFLKEAKEKNIVVSLKLLGLKSSVENLIDMKLDNKIIKPNIVHREHTMPSGLKFFISKGDLVKQTTDAIVNPANNKLQHGGGAAYAIAVAAGEALEDECKAYIDKSKTLPETYAWHSTAGKLKPNIQFVVHAVGPKNLKNKHEKLTAEEYNDLLLTKLSTTFYNCLKYANDTLQISSIAIPAISSGIFGVPMNIVTESMFRGVDNYEKDCSKLNNKERYLKEVHFVNIDDKTVHAICQGYDFYFNRKNDGSSVDRKERHPDNAFTNELPSAEDKLENNSSEVKFDSSYRKKCNSNGKPKSLEQEGFQNNSARSTRHDYSKGDVSIIPEDDEAKESFNEKLELSHETKSMEANLIGSKIENKNLIANSSSSKGEEETCTICLDDVTNPIKLKCGHSFCKECLNENNKKGQQKCPNCGKVYGEIKGNQPKGDMTFRYDHGLKLSGYWNCGAIIIDYSFRDGIQEGHHPNPGKPYRGTRRTAYLPDNKEGNDVLNLFDKAFKKRLLFTIGRSVTTGREDVVVWNDIHQKTSPHGQYGYPDPTYLSRVKVELADKGIE